MTYAGIAKNRLGSYEQAVAWFRRAIEANRNYTLPNFELAAALAQMADSTRRVPQSRRASRLIQHSPSSASSAGAMSVTSTYLAERARIVDGMRAAGVPEQ